MDLAGSFSKTTAASPHIGNRQKERVPGQGSTGRVSNSDPINADARNQSTADQRKLDCQLDPKVNRDTHANLMAEFLNKQAKPNPKLERWLRESFKDGPYHAIGDARPRNA